MTQDNKIEKTKKFLCPHCGADLEQVGLKNSQRGYMNYNCSIISKTGEIGNWEQEDFETDEAGIFYCAECYEELDLEELGLSI